MLVDDHPVVRAGYRHLLDTTPDIRVTAEAEDGESACISFRKHKPDVVILDLSMPGIGGLETISRILAQDADAHILVFSMHDNETLIMRCLKAGALGYLTKDNGYNQMAEAVRSVAQGKIYIDSAHSNAILSQQLTGAAEDPLRVLSPREFQIFQMSAEGHTQNEIAVTLSISPSTVGVHHANIMKKLGLHNATQLVRLAISCKVIQMGDVMGGG